MRPQASQQRIDSRARLCIHRGTAGRIGDGRSLSSEHLSPGDLVDLAGCYIDALVGLQSRVDATGIGVQQHITGQSRASREPDAAGADIAAREPRDVVRLGVELSGVLAGLRRVYTRPQSQSLDAIIVEGIPRAIGAAGAPLRPVAEQFATGPASDPVARRQGSV